MTDPRHPSYGWGQRAYVEDRGTDPADREAFETLMNNERFPRASAYDPSYVWGNHMGPHVLWLTEWLSEGLDLKAGMRVLDMGCGTAISSIFLAHEFGVEVWAADLWVAPHRNFWRIAEAGLMEQVYAIHAEARAYPFQKDFFDAAVSVDAYHYFGLAPGHVDYVASFVKPGGSIGIVVPGDSSDTDVVTGPNGDQISSFRSADWWSRLWSQSDVVTVEDARMFDDGWQLWRRFVEAGMAWDGSDDPGGDGHMLDANPSLGFMRMVGRRTG